MKIIFVVIAIIFTFSLNSESFAKEQQPVCPQNEHWVKAHHRNAYTRSDGTFVSESNVRSHCKTNPPSYSLWKNRLNSNPSKQWLNKKEKSRKWTTDEEEKVLEALSELPVILLVNSVKNIYRLEKSSSYDKNPAAGEEGEIAIYDAAFSSKTNLTRVLSHEFAHELYRQLSVADKTAYAKTAGWLAVKLSSTTSPRWIPTRDNSAYVENDGPESMTEDFSNNIEYFLFDSQVLQRKTPKVFNWIKKKFGDNFKLVKGGHK